MTGNVDSSVKVQRFTAASRSCCGQVTPLLAALLLTPLIASAAAAPIPPRHGPSAASATVPVRLPARVLEPVKLYTGLNRSILLKAHPASGGMLLTLHDGAGQKLAEAKWDGDDLGMMLPQVWSSKASTVFYVQANEPAVGDAPARPIGAPMVVQQLTAPRRAVLDRRTPERPVVVFPELAPEKVGVISGVRCYVLCDVHMQTTAGDMFFRLRADCAPNTAWNFRELVAGGFYDGTDFFRIVAAGSRTGKGFVVQGGDPTNAEPFEGGPGYDIDLEASTLPHGYGVLSMARDTEPDTAGSQFFIALTREETARLDGQYAAFGQLLATPAAEPAEQPASEPAAKQAARGPVEVLGRIAASPLKAGKVDRAAEPVRLLRATLVDAPPLGTGAPILKLEGNAPGAR